MNKEDFPDQVFVYGSLRQGLHNHRYLCDSTFLGVSKVKGIILFDSGNGFPFAVETDQNTDIVVEKYRIDDRILQVLDYLEGHPVFYCRVVKQDEQGEVGYIYINSVLEDNDKLIKVPTGDWKSYHKEAYYDSYR